MSISLRSGVSLAECCAFAAVNSVAVILFVYGVVFWTPLHAGFTDADNLVMASAGGLAYIIASARAGKLADRFGPTRMMGVGYLTATVALGLGWMIPWKIGPILVMAVYNAALGLTWPSIQSLMIRAPSRLDMPARTSLYSISWAPANIIGYVLAALVVGRLIQSPAVFLIPAAIHLAQFLRIATRPAPPMAAGDGGSVHETSHAGSDLPLRVRLRFMREGWLSNAVLCGLVAAFFALAPRLARHLHMDNAATILLLTTFMVVRAASFGILGKWTGWHYKPRWLYAAMAAGPAGVAAVFFIPHPAALVAGLVLFGLSTGLTYSASIYYSHSVGEGQAKHGGFHEAILGIGGFVAPLIAAGGSLLGERMGGWERAPEIALIAASSAALLAGMAVIVAADRKAAEKGQPILPNRFR